MISTGLQHVLRSTGYLEDGLQCAHGVHLGDNAQAGHRRRVFRPDAQWQGDSSLKVYFKYADPNPPDDEVARWRHEIWNEGTAPLLWVISPNDTVLYNGFGRPRASNDASENRLKTFGNSASALDALDQFAGRLAMETGQFWQREPRINRHTSVDQQLLSELGALKKDLIDDGLDRPRAQGLIGRCIFVQYLIDRNIVDEARLQHVCSQPTLPFALCDSSATRSLFEWLCDTFDGDMFPEAAAENVPHSRYLRRVADFLSATDPDTGQQSLFPYQFDVIPVTLISAIYEQFVHTEHRPDSKRASKMGAFYTRISAVSLVLDEVMQGLTGHESVVELTCGSGVFLVEALRRLVHMRSNGSIPTRQMIHSTLRNQVFGIDISSSAIHIAAFSLYLAALELDPNPNPPNTPRFNRLIGNTLFAEDARTVANVSERPSALTAPDSTVRKFDVIVGNPPWTFKGKPGTASKKIHGRGQVPLQPRGESLDFVNHALEFSHDATRIGLILSAAPFFSRSKTGTEAALHVIRELSPATLVNLSNLSSWLFARARMPAVAIFGRHRNQRRDRLTVAQIPWSPSGERTHTFQLAPSDVTELPVGVLEQHLDALKAAAFGRRHDLLLLERLRRNHAALRDQLSLLGVKFSAGLKFGNKSRHAHGLKGLPFLRNRELAPFRMVRSLPTYDGRSAERPRKREIYRAPLVLLKEDLTGEPRVRAAVATQDTLYSDAYYGASLHHIAPDAAYLVAALLNSSIASWFFLMTSSTFGLWRSRLLLGDVVRLPVPDLRNVRGLPSTCRAFEIASGFQEKDLGEEGLFELDEAIYDLYEFDKSERMVVEDGLVRASW